MNDLSNFALKGHLPIFINRFLKVWTGSTFLDPHLQEMGVPQRSILSVTLFSVKINSMNQFLKPVDC